MTKEVETLLQGYEASGLSRLDAIRAAIEEEKIERDTDGSLKPRGVTRKPGRRLLAI
jgi:hypothetical protein